MIHNLFSEIRPRWQIWAPWCLREDKGWSLCFSVYFIHTFLMTCAASMFEIKLLLLLNELEIYVMCPSPSLRGPVGFFFLSGDGTLTLSEVPWRHILSLMSRPHRFFTDLLYQERTSKAFRRQDTIHLQWETQSGVLKAHPRPPFLPLRQHCFWLGPIIECKKS